MDLARPPDERVDAGNRAARSLLSQAAYARHRGVSRNAVHIAVRDGRISTIGAKHLIDAAAADVEWDENTSPSSPKSTAPGNPHRNGTKSASSKLHEHRSRHEAIRVELAELELESKRGRLVPMDQVERQAFEAARGVRDSLMQLPNDLSADLAAAMTPVECERILAGAIRRALADLAGS